MGVFEDKFNTVTKIAYVAGVVFVGQLVASRRGGYSGRVKPDGI